jgi:tetratricopeptide (TPR) repeat protein
MKAQAASVIARQKRKKKTYTAPEPKMKSASPAQAHHLYLAACIVAIVAFLCYANALTGGFVFDDQYHALGNRLLRSITNIPRIMLTSYRPLRDVSYTLDFAIWGERPFGFHLTNLLIHVANSVLVFSLIYRFAIGIVPATVAALIFAVHPMQVDSVTYISGRRDVLFAFFYLASFHCYLTYRQKRSAAYFAMFLFLWALSLMTKEMAASLPFFLLLWNFTSSWDDQAKPWLTRSLRALQKAFSKDKWLYLGLLVSVFIYGCYMVFIKAGSLRARADGFHYWGGSFLTNMLTVSRVHAWYLKQLVFPTPIVQYSGTFDISSTLDLRALLAILIITTVIAAGFALLRSNRLMSFAILSHFVLLLPVSHIIPHHELLADHYLYLPLMSFGLFVALLARVIAARVAYVLATAAIAAFAVVTITRNPVYKDDFTLWQTNYKEAPNSVRAAFGLARHYVGRNPRKATELYERCIELDPGFAPPYVNLAILYQSKDQARRAEEIIQKGLALPDSAISSELNSPQFFRSQLLTALALAKSNQGENEKAEQLLWQAIEAYPANSQPYMLLAAIYHNTDRAKELDLLNKHLAADPNSYDTLQRISSLLIEDGKYDSAITYLDKMVAIAPNDFYANYQLGQIYRKQEDCTRARSHFELAKAAASSPDDISAVEAGLHALELQCGRR